MQLCKIKSNIDKPFLIDLNLGTKEVKHQLIVPSLQGYDILNCDDIIYLYAEGNYTNIYCLDNKRYCYSKVLKYVASKIECKKFLRCHRSYIINTSHLKTISFTKLGYYCLMNNNKTIPISRSNKSVIKGWLNERL